MLASTFITATLTLVSWVPTGARWDAGALPIRYCVTANAQRTQVSANGQTNLIREAVNAWRSSAVGGGLSCTTFDATPDSRRCSPVLNLRDGQNNFFWERSWRHGSRTLGVTHSSPDFSDCSVDGVQLRCLADTDIEFQDTSEIYWVDGNAGFGDTDIGSIAVHEVGHAIGLGHCSDNGTCRAGGAVMYAGYVGGVMRVPQSDDVAGACALYPGRRGGVGWPCTSPNQCSAGLCIDANASGYCTEPCGTCPQGYACAPNPTNPSQNVCLRDDGTNRALCEECNPGRPNACSDNGICVSGLPEREVGRCVTPCPNPGAADGGCPNDYTCFAVNVQGQGQSNYCGPKSSDCTDLGNFSELRLGQTCGQNTPPCGAGLTCIGICTQACNPGACPGGYACESFNFQSGAESFCAPVVGEGENCNGVKACPTGPCLFTQGGSNPVCYLECTGNEGACNNAQQCVQVNLNTGPAAVCDPPGVPPTPAPDPTPNDPEDPTPNTPDPMSMAPDPAPEDPSGETCSCDQFIFCEEGCDCDVECPCECDATFSCDTTEDGEICSCDPECAEALSSGGDCGCTSTGQGPPSLGLALALALAAMALRRRRQVPSELA